MQGVTLRAGRGEAVVRSLRTAVVFFILPAAPLWVLSGWFFIDRAVFNLDLALCVALMLAWHRIGLGLLLFAWLIDVCTALSATYHFTRPLDFFAGARFLTEVKVTDLSALALPLSAIPFAATVLILSRLARQQSVSIGFAIVLGVTLIAADTFNGSSALWARGTREWAVNLAGSPTYTLASQWTHDSSSGVTTPIAEADTTALPDLEAWAIQHPHRSIVFIIVESFGLAVDQQIRTWLEQSLTGPAEAVGYRVLKSTVPFRGATTAGELRHLCRLAGSYRGLTASAAQTCLPQRLRRLGWDTIGLHGFSSRMFDRATWWPLMGLAATHFADTAGKEHARRCGAAFRGLCDDELIDRSFAEALSARRFVYLLTLNTHVPLERRAITHQMQSRCNEARLDDDVCQLVASLKDVLERIGSAAAASPVLPLVVVVGDHAPPFGKRSSRDRFDATHVPAFVLTPAN
jgi:hypothetical protein